MIKELSDLGKKLREEESDNPTEITISEEPEIIDVQAKK